MATTELSQTMQPKEEEIRLPSYIGLIIHIVKTHIKDQVGNVISTIG
ncbi:MAG: hypothetical protein ACQEXX_06410 [Bacillota bacterium]